MLAKAELEPVDTSVPLSSVSDFKPAPSEYCQKQGEAWSAGLKDGVSGIKFLFSVELSKVQATSMLDPSLKACQYTDATAKYCCESAFKMGADHLAQSLDGWLKGSNVSQDMRCRDEFRHGKKQMAEMCKASVCAAVTKKPNVQYVGCYQLGMTARLLTEECNNTEINKYMTAVSTLKPVFNGSLDKLVKDDSSFDENAEGSSTAGSAGVSNQ
jgi:hypothetical protein